MAVYAHIDVSRKQEYIYKDSKLIDNLYNSFIVKAVTEELNLKDLDEKIVCLSEYLKSFNRKFSFIYSGGGNSIIKFEEKEKAIEFVRGYSLEILKNYPDLELYISLVDEDEVDCNDNNKEMLIRERLMEKSDELKDKRKLKFKRLSYGIEKIGENGQAVEIPFKADKEKSGDFHKKLVRRYLFNKFDEKLQGVAIVTEELQKYKKDENGKSYIGVISIDGNQMGKMVNNITNFDELCSFSKAVDKIYFDAIIEALKEYKERLEIDPLIITPILQAGDDICLIVEAEHAIEITAGIIKKIEEISQIAENKSKWSKFTELNYLTACGGAAIVRYTYPFFESIKIAENLCHRAKESGYLIETSCEGKHRKSFINWDIVQSQVNTGIEYEAYVKNRNIKENYHVKPLCIDQPKLSDGSIFSYDAFFTIIKKIQEEGISSTFLEDLKKQIYNGIEQYKLFLDMNEKEKKFFKELSKLVLNEDCEENDFSGYMLFYDNETTYTYILNDVLEALPFVKGEGK